jgi:sterol desaturase/sphingolipid hydroxylase (fatty acid hydroxylase superfamily)
VACANPNPSIHWFEIFDGYFLVKCVTAGHKMLETTIGYLIYPFLDFAMLTSQYFWLTYFTSAALGVAVVMAVRRRRLSFRQARHLVWPKRLVQNPSTLLDAKLYLVGSYCLIAQFVLVGGLTLLSVNGAVAALDHALGFRPDPVGPSYLVTGATMLLVFLAVELGYWFSHWLMHRIPALWEFHKVHHSAQVLTPLTELRQHPVELLLFPMLIGAASSLAQGPMIWYFGVSAQVISPVSANWISMFFWFTTVHLRHTELPIHATGLLGKLIQTPGHHQVHHSVDPKHFNKNLGYCLSVWDWAFGTLYMPSKDEKLTYGLGHQDSPLETVIGSMFAPFGRAAGHVMSALGWRAAPDVEAQPTAGTAPRPADLAVPAK